MNVAMLAIEETGIIDQNHRLQLDRALPIHGPKRVRVIVLYATDEEWDEGEWLLAAATNPAFESLKEPREDIYSIADGEPFTDQG